MNLEQERELVEGARRDPEIFGELFDRYYSPILNYVVRRVGDVALAEDLTSEVFIKAHSKLWQFQWRGISFSAWLYRIATNEIRSHFRSKKSTLSLDRLFETAGFDVADDLNLQEELLQAESELERHQDFLQVQAQMCSLPFKYQEVISLRFFEEKSLAEIAEILGKPEGTIKSLLSRGIQKLRDLPCNPSQDSTL